MSKAFLVLGSHRCGTSAVAGTLQALGVEMGCTRNTANPHNEKGQFEDDAFVKLNNRISDWSNSRVRDQHAGILQQVKDGYVELIKERNEAHEFWGCKDPRFCLTAKHFLPLLKDHSEAHVIFCRRSITAATRSLTKRHMELKQKKPSDHWLTLQAFHMAAAYTTIGEHPEVPLYVVDFDQLCERPREVVESLAAFVGKEPTEDALSFPEPKLRHHVD